MRQICRLLVAGMALAGLYWPATTGAQTSSVAPVVVVPHNGSVGPGSTALTGVTSPVQKLILNFNSIRDKFLQGQALLLIQLKSASTPAERQQIRAQLQANRQAFLDALSSFRLQLKNELKALKNKIGPDEFQRIIDAAHDAATEGGLHHHRGQ